MKLLGPKRTERLWDRLENEARSYYETLHTAKSDLQLLGPCDDSDRVFSDLLRWHVRLKRRFTVMAVIGRFTSTPLWGGLEARLEMTGSDNIHTISDSALDCADQVIGLDVIRKWSDNVRIR